MCTFSTRASTYHADLQANLAVGDDSHYAVETCKGGNCLRAWDDDNDHGTHVAGTVGAINNKVDVVGVAPEVTLHAVKVLSKSGSGSWSGVIAGIDWVTQHVGKNGHGGKAVANMSLGGSGSKDGTCPSNGFTGKDSMHKALCNSARAGVVYAVAAGNSGADAQNYVPAAYDDAVITVSATSKADDFESWSNWRDNSASWSNGSAPVAITRVHIEPLREQGDVAEVRLARAQRAIANEEQKRPFWPFFDDVLGKRSAPPTRSA